MKIAVSALLGLLAALGLFLLMHGLISGSGERPQLAADRELIDFIRVRADEQVRRKERRRPDRPEPPKQPPPPPDLRVSRPDRPPRQPLRMEAPRISLSPASGGGPWIGSFDPGDPAAEGDVIPIVRLAPDYPREARLQGIEGWVELEFTINEDGTVSDPTVIDARPRRVFNRSAIRAILRWKFKPRVVDGKPMARRATQRIDFTLDRG